MSYSGPGHMTLRISSISATTASADWLTYPRQKLLANVPRMTLRATHFRFLSLCERIYRTDVRVFVIDGRCVIFFDHHLQTRTHGVTTLDFVQRTSCKIRKTMLPLHVKTTDFSERRPSEWKKRRGAESVENELLSLRLNSTEKDEPLLGWNWKRLISFSSFSVAFILLVLLLNWIN